MNAKYKKSLKIITLLITAAIVATASATTYNYMYIKGSASITTGGLSWALGSSAPGAATVSGYNVNNLNFSILKNTFQNFTDSVRLTNADGTSHTFSLASTVTAGDTSKFTTFDMVVYQTDGTRIAKLSVKNQESAASLTILGSETLYVRFEVDPLLDADSGYMAFTIQLTYT